MDPGPSLSYYVISTYEFGQLPFQYPVLRLECLKGPLDSVDASVASTVGGLLMSFLSLGPM